MLQLLSPNTVDHKLQYQKPDAPQPLVEDFSAVLKAAVAQAAGVAGSKLGDASHQDLIKTMLVSNRAGEAEVEVSEVGAEQLLQHMLGMAMLGNVGLAASSQVSGPDAEQLESVMQSMLKERSYIESAAAADSALKLWYQLVRDSKTPVETGIDNAPGSQPEFDSQPTSQHEIVLSEIPRLLGLDLAQSLLAVDAVNLVNMPDPTAKPGSVVTAAEGNKQGVSTELLLEGFALVKRGHSGVAASEAQAPVPPETGEESASEHQGTGEKAAAMGSREHEISVATDTHLIPKQSKHLMVVKQQLSGAVAEQPANNSDRTEPTTVKQLSESTESGQVQKPTVDLKEVQAQPIVFRSLLSEQINVKRVQGPAGAVAPTRLSFGSDWRAEQQRQRLLNEGSTEDPDKKVESQTLRELKLLPAGNESPEPVLLKGKSLENDPYKGDLNSKAELAVHRGGAPAKSAADEIKPIDETAPKTSSGDRSFAEVSSIIHTESNQATNGYDPETASFLEVRREIAARDLQQVIQEAVLKDDPIRGQKQLDLVLEPRELGSLRVKLVWQDSQIRAEVMASTREALQLLERSFEQLELSLAQKGVTLSGMSLGLMQQHQSNQEWRHPAGNRSKVSAMHHKHESITASAAAHQNTVAEGLLTSSRLNLLL